MTQALDTSTRRDELVIGLDEIGPGDAARVGGKGASLGRLCRAGIAVPPGFCVSTDAYRAFAAGVPGLSALLAEVESLPAGDAGAVAGPAARLRAAMEATPMPEAIAAAVVSAWRAAGADAAYAVRSSATAEDLPDASFAGQQDTYLNVVGERALLDRVRACWASLFTDRAILYRQQAGIAHGEVALSVVVQRMVRSDKSGILFTADPISGHRDVLAIDAGFGLGEALVSGLVSADLYRVDRRDGRIVEVTVGDKRVAIRPAAGGGTFTEELPEDRRRARVLSDGEVAALGEAAERSEALQGCPQDIEWCFEGGRLFVVQARPITSLYPLIEPAPTDGSLHVSFCFNHFQVMTDAMPPMSIALWQLMLPFGKARGAIGPSPWVGHAGGRVFVDVSRLLRLGVTRRLLSVALAGADRLATAGIEELARRPELARGPRVSRLALLRFAAPRALAVLGHLLVRDPAGAAERELRRIERVCARLTARVDGREGAAARLRELRDVLGTMFYEVLHIPSMVLAGLIAGRVLRRIGAGAGENGSGDGDGGEDDGAARDLEALGRGLSGNVTTEMDLAVGDLADLARGRPVVRELLAGEQPSLEAVEALPGGEGAAFAGAVRAFIERYGARGPSEIDVSRDRWRDDPSSILRAVAGNLQHGAAGEHRAHHAALARAGDAAAARIAARGRRGWLGLVRGWLARRMVRVARGCLAVREHPKFFLVQMLDRARREILRAADELVAAGRMERTQDVWMLTLDELCEALEAGERPGGSERLGALVAERRTAFERHQALYPPRVLTSRGEVPAARHDDADVPPGALVGSPASSGQVEGVARVIRDPAREVLRKGEILVAPFTDPGWTPLFLNAAGLVMEVGGLMTHGSVVAREYGIPAVVCVPDATRRIRTGQRIRVDGHRGHVQILADDAGGAAGELTAATSTASIEPAGEVQA